MKPVLVFAEVLHPSTAEMGSCYSSSAEVKSGAWSSWEPLGPEGKQVCGSQSENI